MPIDDELLEILCCPETRQPVARASTDVRPGAPLGSRLGDS